MTSTTTRHRWPKHDRPGACEWDDRCMQCGWLKRTPRPRPPCPGPAPARTSCVEPDCDQPVGRSDLMCSSHEQQLYRCSQCDARTGDPDIQICDACERLIQSGFAADRLRHGDDGLAAALTADLLDHAARELVSIADALAEADATDRAAWYRLTSMAVAGVQRDLDDIARRDPTINIPKRPLLGRDEQLADDEQEQ
jgi:hypothetical protein